MLVLDDPGGGATALAEDVQGRLEALGVYRREAGPGSRTSPWPASGSVRGSGSTPPADGERLFRPTRLLICHDCIRRGAVRRTGIGWLRRLKWTSTKHWT